MTLRTKLLETSEPTSAAFKASGEDVDIQGEINLKKLDENATDLSYKLVVRAQSTIAKLAMSVISSGYINEQTSIFIENLKKAITVT